MKSSAIAIGLLLAMIATSSSVMAVIYEKYCIRFEESYTFSEDRFVGKWYEIRRLEDPIHDQDEHCVQEKFTRSANMMDFEIVRSVQANASAEPVYSTGVASPRVLASAVVPQFFLRYNTTSPADPDTPIDIVKTDYNSYAILYSCLQINSTTVAENAWIYSRRLDIPKPTAELINKFIATKFNHPEHKWGTTVQSSPFCKPTNITNSSHGLHQLSSLWRSLVVLLLAKMLF
uniref:Apolipoprotein D n=1 Tax=Culex pipiens TaxID=7175 RepID=A0A8D8J221_CULPI